MSTINERILLLRENLSLTRKAFGEKLGVSDSVIKNIEYNVTDPKPLLLQQICKVYNVDPYWLETGSGEMFLPMEEEEELLAYAVKMIKNKDYEWIKQLNLTLMSMSVEELEVLEKFVKSYSDRMRQKKEEQ